MSHLPGTVMPATWRRLPVTAPEYEWLSVSNIPRTLWHFWVLIHHRREGDNVSASVLCRAGESLEALLPAVYQTMPQALGAPVRAIAFREFLHIYYFPRLFTRYGFDRAAFGAALRAELPLPMHHEAQRLMRAFLNARGQVSATERARATACKKPRVYRELAQAVGHALYKVGDVLDTWLWRRRQ